MSTSAGGVPKTAPERATESQKPRPMSGGAYAAPTNGAASGSLYGVVVAEVVPPRPARGAQAREPWSESNMREQSFNLGISGKGHTPAAWRQLGARPGKWRPGAQLELFPRRPPRMSGGHISATDVKRVRRGGAK